MLLTRRMPVTVHAGKVERSRLEVPIDPDAKAALREAARLRGMTMSAATRAAIAAFTEATVAAARNGQESESPGVLAGPRASDSQHAYTTQSPIRGDERDPG